MTQTNLHFAISISKTFITSVHPTGQQAQAYQRQTLCACRTAVLEYLVAHVQAARMIMAQQSSGQQEGQEDGEDTHMESASPTHLNVRPQECCYSCNNTESPAYLPTCKQLLGAQCPAPMQGWCDLPCPQAFCTGCVQHISITMYTMQDRDVDRWRSVHFMHV